MKRPVVAATAIIALAVVGWVMAQHSGQSNHVITPAETASLLETHDTSVVFLDVRTRGEFDGESGHLKGALLIPVQELEERMKELEPYRGKKIIAYCRSGNRSGRATTMLLERGFTAVNMTGGMLRWAAEGLPVKQEGDH